MRSQDILATIWRSLQDATTRRTSFTLGHLGTVGADGRRRCRCWPTPAPGQPRVRAVILRHVEPERGRVMFATNVRSAKVDEIGRVPRVALTVYDETQAVQLRMEGAAHVVTDPAERARAWETFGPHSRHLYRSSLTPGSPLPPGEAVADQGNAGEPNDGDRAAFERFAWVGIDLDRFDWLDLSSPRHERWRFAREDGVWVGERIVP